MIRLKIIIIFCLCLQISLQAQTKFGNEMCIGLYGYSIKFENGNYIHDTLDVPFKAFLKGRANICDSNGNIILLSDGMNVYDSIGNYIDEGDTLIPYSWYNEYLGISPGGQSALFLPMDSKKYYFVTPTMNDTQFNNSKNIHPWKAPFNQILYNGIDMNANGGNGKVTERMVPVLENKELFKTCMQACRHVNGKDWWLLKLGGDSTIGNVVYKFLFTQDSVYNMGMQTIPFQFRGYYDLAGQMEFSPNGTRWACTVPNNADGEVFFGNFDRCTGMLTNFQKKNIWSYPTGFPLGQPQADTTNTGLCFSPNGDMLYISRYSHIVQMNLQNNSQYLVWGMDTLYNHFNGYVMLHLGPDNKIYVGHFHGTSRQMSTIDNPDIQGVGCNFCNKCLKSIYKNEVLNSPPNMPNYELGAVLPCWSVGNEDVENGGGELFSVYPNPSSGVLHIRTESTLKRELYNAMGQRLISTYMDEIDTRKCSKGIYYIKCGNAFKKVVVD